LISNSKDLIGYLLSHQQFLVGDCLQQKFYFEISRQELARRHFNFILAKVKIYFAIVIRVFKPPPPLSKTPTLNHSSWHQSKVNFFLLHLHAHLYYFICLATAIKPSRPVNLIELLLSKRRLFFDSFMSFLCCSLFVPFLSHLV